MTSPSPSASAAASMPQPEQAPGPDAAARRPAPHELLGLTSPAYGGDYNPEQWDEAENRLHVQKALLEYLVIGRVPT